jgi:hypothetical protein
LTRRITVELLDLYKIDGREWTEPSFSRTEADAVSHSPGSLFNGNAGTTANYFQLIHFGARSCTWRKRVSATIRNGMAFIIIGVRERQEAGWQCGVAFSRSSRVGSCYGLLRYWASRHLHRKLPEPVHYRPDKCRSGVSLGATSLPSHQSAGEKRVAMRLCAKPAAVRWNAKTKGTGGRARGSSIDQNSWNDTGSLAGGYLRA